MSFPALLTHPLAIVTPTSDGTEDELGHPVMGTPAVELVAGLVQPKSAREIADLSQAGAEVSTHTIFLGLRRLSAASWIRDEPDAGRRFDITGIRSFEYGTVPHLEVDAKLVGSTEGPAAGS